MKLEIYDHRNGTTAVPAAHQKEVKDAITRAASLATAKKARTNILAPLRGSHGWTDKVSICPGMKNTITSQKNRTGLCLQTGNMGRFYADLLKLQYLFIEEKLGCGIVVLPTQALSKQWSANVANYERFVRELHTYSKIITIPLAVIGIPQV
jgi:hypothetical protein